MRTAGQTIGDFCSQLAAGTPAPGGGAAAAVMGAMGAALVAMVAGLTVGRDKYAAVHNEMMHLQEQGRLEVLELLACADDDRAAFERVISALDLPKSTASEKFDRQTAVQEGYKAATRSPLATMAHSISVMRAALAVASRGNTNARSDASVGYLGASAAFEGGLLNIAINLDSLKDAEFKQGVLDEVQRLRTERTEIAEAFKALAPGLGLRFVGPD